MSVPASSMGDILQDPDALQAYLAQLQQQPSMANDLLTNPASLQAYMAQPMAPGSASVASSTPAAPAAPGLMSRLGGLADDPLFQIGTNIWAASGPSLQPHNFAQDLAKGMQGATAMQGSRLDLAAHKLSLERTLAYLQAMQGGQPQAASQGAANPGSAPQGSSGMAHDLGASSSTPSLAGDLGADPITRDPEYQHDLMLSNYAPDAATQTAWLSRARLRYDTLSGSPQYQAEIAREKGMATLPTDVIGDALRYGLRPIARGPTESVYNPIDDPNNALSQMFRSVTGGAGFGRMPSSGGTSAPAAPGASTPGSPNVAPMMSPQTLEFTKEQGEAANKYWEDLSGKADAAQTQNNIIDNMRGDFQSFAPSKTAQYRGKASEWLNALGFPLSDEEKSSLGAYESSNKLGVQLQSAMTKTLGSREAAQVFTTMGNAVPNNTLAPNGFERVADFMQGAGDYQLAKKQYAQKFADAGDSKSMNGVDSQFQKYSDPSFFIISRANPQQQATFMQEMGKAKAQAFLQRWEMAYKLGMAPAVP